jgi:hypothetical protein
VKVSAMQMRSDINEQMKNCPDELRKAVTNSLPRQTDYLNEIEITAFVEEVREWSEALRRIAEIAHAKSMEPGSHEGWGGSK